VDVKPAALTSDRYQLTRHGFLDERNITNRPIDGRLVLTSRQRLCNRATNAELEDRILGRFSRVTLTIADNRLSMSGLA
jgi:hypothetical protein